MVALLKRQFLQASDIKMEIFLLDEETDISTVAVDYITRAKTILDRIESTNEVVTSYGQLDILVICAAGSGCKELGVNLFCSGKVLRNPDKLLKTI